MLGRDVLGRNVLGREETNENTLSTGLLSGQYQSFNSTVTTAPWGNGVSWSNPDGARLPDSSYAVTDFFSNNVVSDFLRFKFADLNIPSNAAIYDVELTINAAGFSTQSELWIGYNDGVTPFGVANFNPAFDGDFNPHPIVVPLSSITGLTLTGAFFNDPTKYLSILVKGINADSIQVRIYDVKIKVTYSTISTQLPTVSGSINDTQATNEIDGNISTSLPTVSSSLTQTNTVNPSTVIPHQTFTGSITTNYGSSPSWSNPTDARVVGQGNAFLVLGAGQISQNLNFFLGGFSVPNEAVITGVEYKTIVYTSSNSASQILSLGINGTASSSDSLGGFGNDYHEVTFTENINSLPASAKRGSYWNNTSNSVYLNWRNNTAGNITVGIDQVTVKISYTIPVTTAQPTVSGSLDVVNTINASAVTVNPLVSSDIEANVVIIDGSVVTQPPSVVGNISLLNTLASSSVTINPTVSGFVDTSLTVNSLLGDIVTLPPTVSSSVSQLNQVNKVLVPFTNFTDTPFSAASANPAWANPGNALTSNGAAATVTVGAGIISQELSFPLGFSLPAGKIIGIKYKVLCRSSSSINNSYLALGLTSNAVGNLIPVNANQWQTVTFTDPCTYSSDLLNTQYWNNTSNTFKLAAFSTGTSSITIDIDSVQVELTYYPASVTLQPIVSGSIGSNVIIDGYSLTVNPTVSSDISQTIIVDASAVTVNPLVSADVQELNTISSTSVTVQPTISSTITQTVSINASAVTELPIISADITGINNFITVSALTLNPNVSADISEVDGVIGNAITIQPNVTGDITQVLLVDGNAVTVQPSVNSDITASNQVEALITTVNPVITSSLTQSNTVDVSASTSNPTVSGAIGGNLILFGNITTTQPIVSSEVSQSVIVIGSAVTGVPQVSAGITQVIEIESTSVTTQPSVNSSITTVTIIESSITTVNPTVSGTIANHAPITIDKIITIKSSYESNMIQANKYACLVKLENVKTETVIKSHYGNTLNDKTDLYGEFSI